MGVITGEKSGITVVDVDQKDGGLEWWESYVEEHGEPETMKVRTGGGGFHYYFRYNKCFQFVYFKILIKTM